ncbi:MAG: Anaerobic nitric oxide reductase transcription regulator NorR [Gammaproteobacteria bacterium]|nr:Anaerobic nitric oxide reductase transcription regulator NorR [Gammaproteobacteria bacterium]
MTLNTNESDADAVIRHIVAGTAALTGADFLQALLPSVAQALNVKYVFVAEFSPDHQTASTLAFWDGGTVVLDAGDYALPGSPCEQVLGGEVVCYPQDVQAAFPEHHELGEMGVVSYVAVPMRTGDGKVMGHLAIMHTEPLHPSPAYIDVFRIFGARACAEMQRKRFEEALAASEERLSQILSSAMDAIIAFDADRRIRLFNPAAERIFGCAAGWAMDQPFDRFLSRPFRALLDRYVGAVGDGSKPGGELWAPDGVSALRANREEFPVEVTLSSFESRGQRLYTVILRDVNERMRARAQLARLEEQNVFLRKEMANPRQFQRLIGESPPLRELHALIETVARSDTTVLITGETGTGKELIAHAIHAAGDRSERMLVKMNCAALPGELIESELFGHEKGAFTGALQQRKGRFEMADGGSLFLDEVGELTLPAQAKLLRVLQEQEFERVGGSRVIKVDVRVIAATNRDLGEMVKAGTFRSDLYYRLNVFPIDVPPLRARREDIPVLVDHFLGTLARKLGRRFRGVDAISLKRLQSYQWPGNIRELQNIIERAAVIAAGEVVQVPELEASAFAPPAGGGAGPLRTLEDVETEHIREVLKLTEWIIEGKRGAAGILGMEPSTLRYRMQKLGIRRPRPDAEASASAT